MTNLRFYEEYGRFNIPVYNHVLFYWTPYYYINEKNQRSSNQDMKNNYLAWDLSIGQFLFFQSPLETNLAISLYGEK